MVPELLISNFERSRAFFVDVLGFDVLFTRQDLDFVYLILGSAQLMLEADDESAWRTAPLEYPRWRGMDPQIDVEDVTHLHDPWYAVNDGQEGQREFLVQDPRWSKQPSRRCGASHSRMLRFTNCTPLRSRPDYLTSLNGTG